MDILTYWHTNQPIHHRELSYFRLVYLESNNYEITPFLVPIVFTISICVFITRSPLHCRDGVLIITGITHRGNIWNCFEDMEGAAMGRQTDLALESLTWTLKRLPQQKCIGWMEVKKMLTQLPRTANVLSVNLYCVTMRYRVNLLLSLTLHTACREHISVSSGHSWWWEHGYKVNVIS